MNIVVCDDQLDYLNLIEKKIVQCFDEKEIPLNTYTYSNIKPLLTDTQVLYLLARVGGKSYEAYFVHIWMYSIEHCKVGLQLVDVFSDR